jgi:hypothetical protein
VLLGVDDGAVLEHPRFAGSDLLVVPARVQRETAEQAAVSV